MTDLFRLWEQPNLRNPSLVVAWHNDAGKLGAKVADYLNSKLGGQNLAEIEPVDFFPLGGVAIKDDLVQFPESKLYACPQNNLVIFTSDPPNYEWFKLINLTLDVAEHCGRIKELYTIGGMVSPDAHTTPRQLIAGLNSPELKQDLDQYNLTSNLDYQTPPGHRPALNSFVLWAARQRNIHGAALWVSIPFYLVATDDPTAQRKMLEFFDQRFSLKIDFRDIDQEIKRQNEEIARARMVSPEVNEYISRLESNLSLSEVENETLVKQIEAFLSGKEHRL